MDHTWVASGGPVGSYGGPSDDWECRDLRTPGTGPSPTHSPPVPGHEWSPSATVRETLGGKELEQELDLPQGPVRQPETEASSLLVVPDQGVSVPGLQGPHW